jgi:CheY-like chemotaxis protein
MVRGEGILSTTDGVPDAPQATVRICLCDDVRDFRDLMRFGLEDDPAIEVVGEAEDGPSAIALVVERQPDVVLLDLSMPGLDGLEVIDALRQRAPDTRIIVLSGFAAARMQEVVLDRGADRYLEKGVSLSEIRSVIHEVA